MVRRSWMLVALLALAACADRGGAEGRLVPATTTTTTSTTVYAPTTTVAPTTTEVPTTTAETTTTTVAETTTTTTSTTAAAPPPPPPPPAPAAPPIQANHQLPSALANRQIGTIWMPRINVAVPMVEGIDDRSLDLGSGHWPGTAMPGQLGNAVIAGHRVSHTKPFRNIDKLQPGDEVIFETADGTFVYIVDHTQIVKPDAVWIVNPTPDATATLFACHPPGSTRERIVVFLKLA